MKSNRLIPQSQGNRFLFQESERDVPGLRISNELVCTVAATLEMVEHKLEHTHPYTGTGGRHQQPNAAISNRTLNQDSRLQ